MSDTGLGLGLAVGIVLFVIVPTAAYLIVYWFSRPKSEAVNWVAYHDSLRPPYTTIPALPKHTPEQPDRNEVFWHDGTRVLETRDWGFCKDVYLEDGRVIMLETTSRQTYKRGGNQ